MTQLPLFAPSPAPAVGFWPALGRWMVGEGQMPPELAASLEARKHRREVNAASGRSS